MAHPFFGGRKRLSSRPSAVQLAIEASNQLDRAAVVDGPEGVDDRAGAGRSKGVGQAVDVTHLVGGSLAAAAGAEENETAGTQVEAQDLPDARGRSARDC